MASAPVPYDADLEALLEHLREVRGADFTGYKRASLTRLVDRRMAQAGVSGYRAYLDHLEVDPGEFARLFDSLLINVTAFYRDPATWEALRSEHLPRIVAATSPDAPLRFWSAACATGEEAYTLALVLEDLLGRDAFRRRVKIYATDVDEGALGVARAARYRARDLEALPEAVVARGFEGSGEVRTFSSELRPSVIFGRHDLIQDAPIGRIDMITCRNVLMYLNHETQSRVLERFAYSLNEGGALVLGRAEMLLTHGDLFAPVDLVNRVFRRVGPSGTPTAHRVRRRPVGGVLTRVAHAAFTAAPEAQVVVDADGSLTLVNDSAVQLLGPGEDDLGRPFQDLEVSYRPVELRTSIEVARSGHQVVSVKDVPIGPTAAPRWYDVQVVPLDDPDEGLLGVQITFLDVTRYHRLADELDAANRELETAYEELQSSNEELETTNEELQSAVEELETTNEELQSTNEELETMNEELQSTNEELQTLNDELRIRTDEVNQVNAFLEGILMGLRGGVVVLDRDLVVQVWNERAERLWGLREHEALGTHFLNLDIGLPVDELRTALREVIGAQQEHLDLRVRAVNRFGRTVQCAVTVSPLRGYDGEVSGAIVLMEEGDADPVA